MLTRAQKSTDFPSGNPRHDSRVPKPYRFRNRSPPGRTLVGGGGGGDSAVSKIDGTCGARPDERTGAIGRRDGRAAGPDQWDAPSGPRRRRVIGGVRVPPSSRSATSQPPAVSCCDRARRRSCCPFPRPPRLLRSVFVASNAHEKPMRSSWSLIMMILVRARCDYRDE